MPTYQFPLVGAIHHFRTPEENFDEVVSMASFVDILAIMLDPKQREAECRERLLAATHAAMIPDVETEGEIEASQPSSQVAFLREACRIDFEEEFANLADNRLEYGILSGYICGWCVFRSQLSGTAASATPMAAFKMVSEAYAKARRIGGSIDHIKNNIWPEYRSVAHLWSAYILLYETHDNWLASALRGNVAAIEDFIFVSERIRDIGEVHKAKNARHGDTLLRPSEMWTFDRSTVDPWPEYPIEENYSSIIEIFDARSKGWPLPIGA